MATLTVDVRSDERAELLIVRGEVDMATTPELWSRVQQALEQAGGRPLVVDLTAVTFLGSHGLALLARAADAAAGEDVPFRVIVGHGRAVRRSIELSGLQQMIPLYPSEVEALDA
jgi:anti-anti-sigma factor